MRLSHLGVMGVLMLAGCESDAAKLERLRTEQGLAEVRVLRLEHERDSLRNLAAFWQGEVRYGRLSAAVADSGEARALRKAEELHAAEVRLILAAREFQIFMNGK